MIGTMNTRGWRTAATIAAQLTVLLSAAAAAGVVMGLVLL